MLVSALNALREVVKSLAPDLKIYVNRVPQNFEQASYYIGFVESDSEPRDKTSWIERQTWVIVYFAPDNVNGDIDRFDQLQAVDIIRNHLMNAKRLLDPQGNQFDVISAKVAPREDEMAVTVTLEGEHQRVI